MTLEKGNRSAVVVGGGIGGLSAALALAKRGCRVTVIEQADKFGEIGAGIQIGPNGFHAMDYLGIGERARARAVYIEAIIMMDGMSGEQIFHTPLDDDFRTYFGNPYAVIHRADLHGSLLEGCQSSDLVTLVNSEKIVSCENTANGAKVTTASGKTFEADAAIGADGINSVIRKFIAKGEDPMRLSGHVAYRAVLPIEQMPVDLRWSAATLWGAPKCHLVHYALQGWKTFNIVATFVTGLKNVGSNEP